MRFKWQFSLPLLLGVIAALVAGGIYAAQAASGPTTALFDEMFVPALGSPLPTATKDNFNSFDIGWVDPNAGTNGQYYLADKGSPSVRAGFIDVFDAKTDLLIKSIPGMAGGTLRTDMNAGPNGVYTSGNGALVWVGDGDSTIKVFNGTTSALVASVSTGGTYRTDEGGFDTKDNYALFSNDDDTPPFSTIVNSSYTIIARIQWDGQPNVPGQTITLPNQAATPIPVYHGPNATGGIEQAQWDANLQAFVIANPATTGNPGGEIDEINPQSFAVTTLSTLGGQLCTPNGLSVNTKNGNLLVGCSAERTMVISGNGSVVMNDTNVGGSDEVWYNSGNDRYYTGSSNNSVGPIKTAVLGIYDANANAFIQSISTVSGSHSVAADPKYNQVFVPIKGANTTGYSYLGGVAVFTTQQDVTVPTISITPITAPSAPTSPPAPAPTATPTSSGGGGGGGGGSGSSVVPPPPPVYVPPTQGQTSSGAAAPTPPPAPSGNVLTLPVPASGMVTLTYNGQPYTITVPAALLQGLPAGDHLQVTINPNPSGLNSVQMGSLGGGIVVPLTGPIDLTVTLQDGSGNTIPMPVSLASQNIQLELPVLASGVFAWLRELDVNGQFAGYIRDAATFDPNQNGLVISVPLGSLSGTLFLPAQLQPAWVSNFDPNVHMWSGPTTDASDFGTAGPQGTIFPVVGPQVLNRIYVFDPVTQGYGWIDASGIGPSGAPSGGS